MISNHENMNSIASLRNIIIKNKYVHNENMFTIFAFVNKLKTVCSQKEFREFEGSISSVWLA